MSARQGDQNITKLLQDMQDRLKRLETGTTNKGRISFTQNLFGLDIQIQQALDPDSGRTALEIRRMSDDAVCYIDPGDCCDCPPAVEAAPVVSGFTPYFCQVAMFSDGPDVPFDVGANVPFSTTVYTDGVGAVIDSTPGSEGIMVTVPGIWHINTAFKIGASPGAIGGDEYANIYIPSGPFVSQHHVAVADDKARNQGFNLVQDAYLAAGSTVRVAGEMRTPTDPLSTATAWYFDSGIATILSLHYVGPYTPASSGCG